MEPLVWMLTILGVFGLGLALGRRAEAGIWRHKGDHKYMNTNESGGKLYIVKREGS